MTPDERAELICLELDPLANTMHERQIIAAQIVAAVAEELERCLAAVQQVRVDALTKIEQLRKQPQFDEKDCNAARVLTGQAYGANIIMLRIKDLSPETTP